MNSWIKLCWCVLVFGSAVPQFAAADDWPQWLGPKRDSIWRETGIVERFPKGGPQVAWRVPVYGGYAGPAVAGGRVYVTDFQSKGDKSANPARRNELDGQERVLCVDAKSGETVWKHEYPCHYKISYPAGPRATPLVHEGKVYTLGAMGDLFCLDAQNGEVLWSRDLKKDYHIEAPIWGFAGHPLIDGQYLYCLVGGEGSVVVAFDKDSGKELWKALSASEPGYSPPTMVHSGGRKQLAVWHAESINGLNPETGEVYWSTPLQPQYGMSIMAPIQAGDYLFAGGTGQQAVLLQLANDRPAVEELWRGTPQTAVYPICSAPVIDNGVLYGCCQSGELRAVDLETGKRLWETIAPTSGGQRAAGSAAAFLVKNGDRFFLMSETGDLIIARLTPQGYEELDRAHLLEPTGEAFGRSVLWSHPAFADRSMFARNDKELIRVSLAAD